MSFPRKLLVALLFLAACTTADRAVREPVPPTEAPAPPATAAVPQPEPEPAFEESREAEEEVEVVELPPPPDAEATGSVVEVSFAAGGAALTPASRSILDRMSDAFPDDRTDYYLEIQGHTDPSGSETANLELAEQRAEAVRRYLHRERGVPMAAMGVVPLGSSAPAADNATLAGRERNRRAVVVFLPPP